MSTSSLLFGFSVVAAQLTVHTPPSVAGEYADESLWSGRAYEVNGLVAVAVSCPCKWLWTAANANTPLLSKMLLVPEDACESSCGALGVSCAAALYNVSSLLLSAGFNNASAGAEPGDDATSKRLEAERASYARRTQELGCDAGLPGSLITANLSGVLLNAVTWKFEELASPQRGDAEQPSADVVNASASFGNATDVMLARDGDGDEDASLNVTIRSVPEEPLIDCTKYELVPLVYATTVPLWLLLLAAWVKNTYHMNEAHTKDLHRLMTWVPLVEVGHGVLSLFNYLSCPWDTILSLIFATFWSIGARLPLATLAHSNTQHRLRPPRLRLTACSVCPPVAVTILKEPIILLCLLLVAKGWGITRHSLERREICVAGSILALLYASVSVNMSLQTAVSQIPMIIMYLAMLGEISSSVHANVTILSSQLHALRNLEVLSDPTATPVHMKLRMFQVLAGCVGLYACLEVTIHVYFANTVHDHYFAAFIACHQAMELVVATSIGYTFRARSFHVHFSQAAQVAAELADQMLAPFTTIQVEPTAEESAGRIAWRTAPPTEGAPTESKSLPPTLLLLNPGDVEVPQPCRASGVQGAVAPHGAGQDLGDESTTERSESTSGPPASAVSMRARLFPRSTSRLESPAAPADSYPAIEMRTLARNVPSEATAQRSELLVSSLEEGSADSRVHGDGGEEPTDTARLV